MWSIFTLFGMFSSSICIGIHIYVDLFLRDRETRLSERTSAFYTCHVNITCFCKLIYYLIYIPKFNLIWFIIMVYNTMVFKLFLTLFFLVLSYEPNLKKIIIFLRTLPFFIHDRRNTQLNTYNFLFDWWICYYYYQSLT
jgi:hypothetical protein